MGKCVIEGGRVSQGSWYWVRDKVKGGNALVVMVAWMFSSRRYHMPYVHLFNELGAECLVVQPHPLNLWFPERAAALATRILDEIAEELEKRPRPVCFVSFSGGTKSCSYIVIQILQGKCERFTGNTEKYDVVRRCAAGYIFDSTPLNFASETGVLFVRRMLGRTVGGNFAVRLILEGVAKALDSMYNRGWKDQEAELQSAFHAAVEMAPALFLCSKDDMLAPFEEMVKFYSKVETSGNVTLVSWEKSDHVAHFRRHPEEYRDAVSRFWTQVLHGPSAERDTSAAAAAATEHMVRLQDVSHMVPDDVYDLQHDCKSDLVKKHIGLTFPPVRSRL